MTSLSRASWRALLFATLGVLALAGCGSSDTPASSTSTPALPSISPTVTFTDDPTEEPTDPATGEPTDDATTSAGAQLVEVEKFGIAFELPKGWITLDAKKVLKGGGENPVLDELSDRLGTSRDQLVQAFSTIVQTMSVSDEGAVHGFLDNVNTVGQDGDVNDDQLKLQLATIGAKPGQLEHATSDAGDLTVVHYSLSTKTGLTIRAVAVAVRTGKTTLVITVSSSSDARATTIADQVRASLRRIPGTGPSA